MTPGYPRAFDEIPRWAREHGTGPGEARQRFAQYAVLRAVTNSRRLSDLLVLKGGNALNFVWQPNRSTTDLDFSVHEPGIDGQRLQALLQPALGIAGRDLGVLMRIRSVKQQPPGAGKIFITYAVSLGYALPDDTRNRARLERGEASAASLALDVSINEPICEEALEDIRGTHRLRVCTLEDIVGEKLRSLLQQPLRNRHRRQDLLDIAVAIQNNPRLDREKVARYLLEKAAAREVPVSKVAFRSLDVANRAQQGYEELKPTVSWYIPFIDAFDLLLTFVATLSIPDGTSDDPSSSTT